MKPQNQTEQHSKTIIKVSPAEAADKNVQFLVDYFDGIPLAKEKAVKCEADNEPNVTNVTNCIFWCENEWIENGNVWCESSNSRVSFDFIVSAVFFSRCICVHAGDTTGQVEPLLGSFDEPTPLTAIPVNVKYARRLIDGDTMSTSTGNGAHDDDVETDTERQYRRSKADEDEDAQVPLLTSPEVRRNRAKMMFIVRLLFLTIEIYIDWFWIGGRLNRC